MLEERPPFRQVAPAGGVPHRMPFPPSRRAGSTERRTAKPGAATVCLAPSVTHAGSEEALHLP
jgi:hypothetical protein